jgi:hypothetical protein
LQIGSALGLSRRIIRVTCLYFALRLRVLKVQTDEDRNDNQSDNTNDNKSGFSGASWRRLIGHLVRLLFVWLAERHGLRLRRL